jgi:hypothetical protein
MLQAADALTRRAHCLKGELQSSPEQPLVPVVSGISSMQDIMADLLLWARCSQGAPQTEPYSPVS